MTNTIRIVGFDLDQTLYPKSPKIDEAIQKYIYERISQHQGCTLAEAERRFKEHYPSLSGSKTLEKLKIPNAREIVQEALERADIAKFLHPSPEIRELLQGIRKKYGSVSLLTGSDKPIALKKLKALEIPLDLFDFTTFGEPSKSTGEAYVKWIDHFKRVSPTLQPQNFLYIGDRYASDVEIPERMGIQAWLVNNPKEKHPNVRTFTRLLDVRKELLD